MRSNCKDGLINETMIRTALDKHYFKELSEKWKKHMKRMFPNIVDDDKIIAMTYPLRDAKPDLIIVVNSRRVYLSVKSGHSPQVHQEPIYTFFDFLKSFDVPDRILKIMKFYHYGAAYMIKEESDRIYTREEIIEKFPNLIKEVNNYFSKRPELVSEIAYRTIIKGRLNRDLVDYFYYGNVTKGFLLSVSDILRLITKSKDWLSQTLCFKQLTYIAASRHLGDPLQKQVKINWPILCKWYYDFDFMAQYG